VVGKARSMAGEFQNGDGCACFHGLIHHVVALGFVERIQPSVRTLMLFFDPFCGSGGFDFVFTDPPCRTGGLVFGLVKG
jgi:hypothetical protein